VGRARIEEGKLADQFDDYKAYLERTQFILPGLY
jgi:protein-S-isoprenylcysteine O-methyltransferase Ste14